MKKRIIILLVIVLMIPANLSHASNSHVFKDTKIADWFTKDVSYLVNRGGISGYPDGSFKPNQAMNKAEFIKTLVASIGFDNLKPTDSHWASGYVDKALELDLISKKHLNNMDRSINRYEMAEIISNTLAYKRENMPTNIDKYASKIKDIHKITDGNLYTSVVNYSPLTHYIR